ncbi:MAG: hypothetical protein ACQEQF_00005 [Bacillota bacterium]
MEAMLVLLVSLIAASIILIILDWLTHISMVRNNTEKYGWSNFNKFKEKFEEYNMIEYEDELFNGSYIRYKNRYEDFCKVHADIIMFDNKGMILGFISYIKFKLFIMKIKSNSKKTVRWEDE